jgi:hypothetical protein
MLERGLVSWLYNPLLIEKKKKKRKRKKGKEKWVHWSLTYS